MIRGPPLRAARVPAGSTEERIRVFLRVRPPAPSDTASTSISTSASTSLRRHPQASATPSCVVTTLTDETDAVSSHAGRRGSTGSEPKTKHVVSIPNPRSLDERLAYRFDRILDAEAQQGDVFDALKDRVLRAVHVGHNASLFSYGQTGSGKTWTTSGTMQHPGLVPRLVDALFALPQATFASATATTIMTTTNTPSTTIEGLELAFSVMEIYNEKIYDLGLPAPCLTGPGLDLREGADRKVYVAGLSDHTMTSLADFNQFYSAALQNRRTAATKLNHESSRSHFILRIKAKLTKRVPLSSSPAGVSRTVPRRTPPRRTPPRIRPTPDACKTQICESTLFLVDLAGSEDNKRTANVGQRMIESQNINRSLFTLCQCVVALNKMNPSGAGGVGSSTSNGPHVHVPFRNSKITRLLSDALGGNALGIIIACISPEAQHLADTYNTLEFARKASRIATVVTVNAPPPPTAASLIAAPPLASASAASTGLAVSAHEKTLSREARLQRFRERQQAASGLSATGVAPSAARPPSPTSNTSTGGPATARRYVAAAAPSLKRARPLSPADPAVTGTACQAPKRAKSMSATLPSTAAAAQTPGAAAASAGRPMVPLTPRTRQITTLRLMAQAGDHQARGQANAASACYRQALALTLDPALLEATGGASSGHDRASLSLSLDASGPAMSGPAIGTMNGDTRDDDDHRILAVLNHGTVKELQSLHTVGAKRADAIWHARQIQPFSCRSDLLRVPGMTVNLIDRLWASNAHHPATAGASAQATRRRPPAAAPAAESTRITSIADAGAQAASSEADSDDTASLPSSLSWACREGSEASVSEREARASEAGSPGVPGARRLGRPEGKRGPEEGAGAPWSAASAARVAGTGAEAAPGASRAMAAATAASPSDPAATSAPVVATLPALAPAAMV